MLGSVVPQMGIPGDQKCFEMFWPPKGTDLDHSTRAKPINNEHVAYRERCLQCSSFAWSATSLDLSVTTFFYTVRTTRERALPRTNHTTPRDRSRLVPPLGR